ncbi:response regulator transcription factor [Geminisphaera colitermitum]|uniref:response regulator transcription factor n=1 Tax=Geminisphaera colitermitum TaxID=1148786 RepID=UPI000158D530|nr:response regulator transcription factor [Geminisphaera colitermitum]
MNTDAPQPLILVVEDEPALAELIASFLQESGMRTQVCLRAAAAQAFLADNDASLILLDINLPDKTGFELIGELRSQGIATPVIFVTGNTLETSKVKGLELGGDDYVTKPFSYVELVARVRAVLRRTETRPADDDSAITKNVAVSDEPFEFCGATINPERLEIQFADGRIVKLGRKEIGLIACLKRHAGVVITRKMLIHAVWGDHANVRSRSLDQYIVKVRDLFKTPASANGAGGAGGASDSIADPAFDAIRTVHGVGFIYEPEPPPPPPSSPSVR